MKGVDLSHHQGVIDFHAVKKAGVEFAILKASEGPGFLDAMFKANARAAHDAGLMVGAYHFARVNTSPVGQADLFIRATEGLTLTAGCWLDYEDRDNKSSPLTRKMWAETFMLRLLKARPRVGWYADQGYIAMVAPSAVLKTMPLWLAAPHTTTFNTHWYVKAPAIHQYEWFGHVPGVNAKSMVSCDLDEGMVAGWDRPLTPPRTLWLLPDGQIVLPLTTSTALHLAPVQVVEKLGLGWVQVAHTGAGVSVVSQ